jgi:uncharacterized protein (DUF885 family)
MPYRFVFLSLVFFILNLACSTNQNQSSQFEKLANNYIEKFLKMNPVWATSLGDHRYDYLMDDYSLEGVKKTLKFNRSYLDSLNSINKDKLSETNRIDYQILISSIKSTIFSLDTLREYEWNPRVYNIGSAIYSLVARDFAPLRERLQNVKKRLQSIPPVLEEARKNLKNPPKIHTETAILQNKGNINLITTELDFFLEQSPDLKKEFEPIQKQVAIALEDYGKWLEKELLPKSSGDFRLGDEIYRKKLSYTLESDFSKEKIGELAQTDLKETQNVLYETALPLYKTYFPNKTAGEKKNVIKAVLDKLAGNHPNNSTIIDLARKATERITLFVRQKELVTVPDEEVRIIVMPEFQRGVAVAYCDAPGPLETKKETFYAISPTPGDWSKKRVNSFFREYNNYMLENLTVHEAMPGHYLQLAHANQFNAPTMIRSIFYSGTFVEGWATYAEQLMVEYGYGGSEVKMQQLKMRLRLIINALIDQKIHTEGMTEKEAMDMMMNEGFQEEGEAAGKWRRACLTSTQLSTYYVGNIEINDIVNRYRDKMAADADAKNMHDAILSFGSPAPKYVKQSLEI